MSWTLICGCGDALGAVDAIDDTDMGRIWQGKCLGCGAEWTVELALPWFGDACSMRPAAPGRWRCPHHGAEVVHPEAVGCPVWARGMEGHARLIRWARSEGL